MTTHPTLPLLVATLAWASLTTIAAAQDADRQLDEIEEFTRRADEMTRQVISELKAIEDDRKALLRELGEADERAERERARAQQLEQELARLRGDAAAAADPSAPDAPAEAPPPQPQLTFLDIPARKVNALGAVDVEPQPVAPAPPVVSELRFLPLAGLELQEPLTVVAEGATLTFAWAPPLQDRRVVASLRAEAGQFIFDWPMSASHVPADVLARFDRAFASAVIEAVADGAVTGRYQTKPRVVQVKASEAQKTAPIAGFPEGMPAELLVESAAPGWHIDTPDAQTVHAVAPQSAVSVAWRPEQGALQIHTGPGYAQASQWLDHQIQAWQRDLAEEKAKDPQNPNRIQRIERELERLVRQRAMVPTSVDVAPAAGQRAQPLVLRLVAPNGVVLGRVAVEQ